MAVSLLRRWDVLRNLRINGWLLTEEAPQRVWRHEDGLHAVEVLRGSLKNAKPLGIMVYDGAKLIGRVEDVKELVSL